MPVLTACPDRAGLQALIDSTLPDADAAEFTAHVDSCSHCQLTLEELAGVESFSPAASRPRVIIREAMDTTLRRAVQELKRESDLSDSWTDEADLAARDDVSLEFLDPLDKPGCLGRLSHYEVTEVVGRGGMGVVLKAFDPPLNRFVAIKVLAPQLATSAAARKRFAREAKAAAAINHDHVVAVHAVDEWKGLPYLVMQYISGVSLQERLDRDGPLELKEILRIGMQVAGGLAAAHDQGLVHRDIKPANILLENGVERVKITDLGLARAIDDASLTRSGFVAGTPQYMAPEQAAGEPIDHRADLFSLGSVLYALAIGHPPFRAENAMAVLRRVCDESPRRVSELNPDIPDWLADIIGKLHAKNPLDRFQSAAEVAELLRQYLAHLRQPTAVPQPPALKPRTVEPRQPRRNTRRWLAAAVVLVIVTGFGLSRSLGVTSLSELMGQVVRVVTPRGTLVIETDDPSIHITVDGENVTIDGTGLGQLTLRPGSYQVQATRDGALVHDQPVTISRGGRQVVKVTLEPAAAAASRVRVEAAAGQIGMGRASRDQKFVTVRAAEDGIINEVIVETGELVAEGNLLARMSSPSLELELRQRRAVQARYEAARAQAKSQEGETAWRTAAAILNAYGEEIKTIEKRIESFELRAPIAGRIATWEPKRTLIGRPAKAGEVLLHIEPLDRTMVTADPNRGVGIKATLASDAPQADAIPTGPELDKLVQGRIVRSLPVVKDCMVLAYIPEWNAGDVDNIGVGNNDGGVRTLIDWPAVSADDAAVPGRKFLLALYSRMTNSKPPAGLIGVYEIEADWRELTSWTTQPRVAAKPATTCEFMPGEGWKLFDVTPIVRGRAKSERKSFGVMLRFENEDRSGTAQEFSDYKFVSREGAGEWSARRPVLLVVDPTGPANKNAVEKKKVADEADNKAASGQENKNPPNAWIQLDSHEGTSGPQLLLYLDDDMPQSISAAADATIISYLADQSWGRMPWLAVDMRDANRTLLRFELPAAGKFRKAELVVTHRLSAAPPTKPFELGFFQILEEWNEEQVMWKSQPKFDESPALTVPVDPKMGELRFDVTKLVERAGDKKSPRHGWLIKVANPVGGARVQFPDLEAELLRLVPWESTVPQAIAKARDEQKLLLAVVRGSWNEQAQPSFAEQLLLSTVLADPDVLAIIRERFVPVRVSYPPSVFTHQTAGPESLQALGTSGRETKALALVASDADGRTVGRLTNIGTFDRDLILRFLLSSIGKVKRPEVDQDNKGVWKLVERGELDAAQQLYSRTDSRENRYGLCRVASLRGDHATALRIAEPLARDRGPMQHEAMVEAGIALMRMGRASDAVSLLQAAVNDSVGARSADAVYYAGCLHYRNGEPAAAVAAWKSVVSKHAESPFALRAKARLAWPESMAIYENLTALELSSDPESTEVNFAERDAAPVIERAIDYLLAQQHADGSWPVAKGEQWQAAVTALVARSLHRWSGDLTGDHRDRASAAARKATVWLNRQLEDSDPKTMDSFGAAYLVDYFVDLEQSKAEARGETAKAIRFLLDGQCPNGAWSYSHRFGMTWKGGFGGWPVTTQGRFHSVNTGPALVALARARDCGFDVNAAALDAGSKVLLAMRDGAGTYTYTYPEPISFRKPDASIARGPVCEESLCRLGASSKDDLKAAIDRFMEYRGDLRLPVKLDESWGHPHNFSSYFYFFAYAHAASAIAFHGESAAEKLRLLSSDLLRVVELDGTWVDFEMVGKPYGTAMALYVLHLARQANASTSDDDRD